MRISSTALTAVVLLANTTTHAFAPQRVSVTGKSCSSSSALFTATSSSNAAAAVDVFVQVGTDLGLQYTPIVPFGKGRPEHQLGKDAKRVLGGKGANLAEMSELGLSVPPGMTLTTECCDRYGRISTANGGWNNSLPTPLWEAIVQSLEAIQQEMSSEFGSPDNPLLLSVRSGAAISMPGMVRTKIQKTQKTNTYTHTHTHTQCVCMIFKKKIILFYSYLISIYRHFDLSSSSYII